MFGRDPFFMRLRLPIIGRPGIAVIVFAESWS